MAFASIKVNVPLLLIGTTCTNLVKKLILKHIAITYSVNIVRKSVRMVRNDVPSYDIETTKHK